MSQTVPKNSSRLEISKSAIRNNCDYIRRVFCDSGQRLSFVIKGNAYGHDIETMVKAHQTLNNIDHFTVYSVQEAYRAHQGARPKTTIMIIGYVPLDALEWVLSHEVEFFLYDTTQVEPVIACARRLGKKAKIHIEAETGMNRTGVLLKNFKKLLARIEENMDCFEVVGLCTHFAGAESMANHIRVQKQIKKFKAFESQLADSNIKPQLFHTACSAAAIRFKNTRMDLLRVGILQYGFWPNQETYIQHITKHKIQDNPLKPVITWKTEVMTVKWVKRGDYVGYGTSYFTNEDKLVAVLPVGYANGFSRSLSNQARVLINGEFAPVIGTVNMNAISVDVTNIPNVEVGDEVVLIGRQGHQEITVASFSDFTDQLNYEVLTRLPLDIPRALVD
jgi:alanine racemase